MKISKKPIPFAELVKRLSGEQLVQVLNAPQSATSGKYLHWDELLHRIPPLDFTHEQWWLGLKVARRPLMKAIPLRDTHHDPFSFLVTDGMQEQLHHIDLGAGGRIGAPDPILNSETRDRYYISSLMEEAITSSQLEGASTTRDAAKAMIRDARPPRDRSERMILNNFQTMQRIQELKGEPLTRSLVLDLHRLITTDTFDDGTESGRFRRSDEDIVVGDWEGRINHRPPHASEIEERVAAMCAFANAETPDVFIHPVVRAIILHFWLAYDHPFTDGNGRTARALFYWAMLRNEFWLFEYISISRVLLKAPAKYHLSFLHTETDENDLTYFLILQMEVIQQAVTDLHAYIKTRTARLRLVEQNLRGMNTLNHRQRALVGHALRHPGTDYTIAGHQISHNVVYQTARADLLDLAARGILSSHKTGRTIHYVAIPDIEKKLAQLS